MEESVGHEVTSVEYGKRPHSTSSAGENSPPSQRRRYCEDLKSWRDFPDSFTDLDITAGLNGDSNFSQYRKFPLACGLLMKLRSGYLRVYGRSNCRFPRLPEDQHAQQFYDLVMMFCYENYKLREEWVAETIWKASEVITIKAVNVDVHLQREMYIHPLYPLDAQTGWPCFHKEYLTRVREYHDSLRRPEGTFTVPHSDLIDQLVELPRVICPKCNHARHLYCGPCGGFRMANASELFPPKIELPFNVHLVLHWAESLMKCTGIHAGVFTVDGATTYVDWKKDDEIWQGIVESWDPEVDVLLFPFPDSTPADEFDWSTGPVSGSSEAATTAVSLSANRPKRRLMVLEASWQHAKAMSQRIIDHRKAKGLPPIPSVILKNVTGEYWRFQTVGQSAVSTIEAIAHTARAAGCAPEAADQLLTLFKLQKHRVLSNSKHAKMPRAIEVEGVALGSWRDVCAIDDTGRVSPNHEYDSK